MKKVIYALLLMSLALAPIAYADWDYYEETEENSPAYQDGSVNNNNGYGYDYGSGYLYGSPVRDDYSNDTVEYYDKYGNRQYTTRAFANAWGLGTGLRRGYDRGYSNYGTSWNPGTNTIGKRFYPNSNYKREVKAKKQKGLVSSILGWLL